MTDETVQFGVAGSPGEPASVFAMLARMVYASDDFTDVYEAVCRVAPLLVAGCDHASLMLRRDGELVTVAANDKVAWRIDEFERALAEGPCVDAVVDEGAYVDGDLTNGSPWPKLAAKTLAETPVRGVAGFRLAVDDKKAGALNLFSDTPGGLSAGSVDEAIVLASFVSVALLAAHHRETATTLRQGLQSNREIGKAIGLLMAFHKTTDEEAFDLLRKASQDMNVKLADIAAQVVSHHNAR